MSEATDLADALVSGRTYSARTYRSHDAENPPPFVPTVLFVQHHKGRAVGVTPRGYDWAEMDPRQECWLVGDDVLGLMAEDYQLDIEIASIRG